MSRTSINQSLKMLTLLTMSFLVKSCVTYTPMSNDEISRLTTCQTSLDDVRRNLLLAGYRLEHATDEELITDFKQTRGRTWQRVTVVKDGESQVRYRLRTRSESTRELPTETHTTTITDSSPSLHNQQPTEAQRRLRTASHRAETIFNDSDISYYQEDRESHIQTKYEVCGHN